MIDDIYELAISKYGEGNYIPDKKYDNICLVFRFNSGGYIMYDYNGYAEVYKDDMFIESFGDIQTKAQPTIKTNKELEVD